MPALRGAANVADISRQLPTAGLATPERDSFPAPAKAGFVVARMDGVARSAFRRAGRCRLRRWSRSRRFLAGAGTRNLCAAAM